jgi:hypothetical protein
MVRSFGGLLNVSAFNVEPLALRAEAASALGLWHFRRRLL